MSLWLAQIFARTLHILFKNFREAPHSIVYLVQTARNLRLLTILCGSTLIKNDCFAKSMAVIRAAAKRFSDLPTGKFPAKIAVLVQIELAEVRLEIYKHVLTVPREADDPDSNESARPRFGDTMRLRVAWKHRHHPEGIKDPFRIKASNFTKTSSVMTRLISHSSSCAHVKLSTRKQLRFCMATSSISRFWTKTCFLVTKE